MIEYSSYAKDELKDMIQNEGHLADIDAAHMTVERLAQALYDLLSQLERCERSVQARISEYQSKISAAETAAREARAAASRASAELAKTPYAKVVRPTEAEAKAGATAKVVPINEEKIRALKAKIGECSEKAEKQEREALRLKERMAVFERDLRALSEAKAKLNEYIREAECLREALTEARGKADTLCQEHILRDIERIEAIARRYAAVRCYTASYGDVAPPMKKE